MDECITISRKIERIATGSAAVSQRVLWLRRCNGARDERRAVHDRRCAKAAAAASGTTTASATATTTGATTATRTTTTAATAAATTTDLSD
jgi:hypothetical protein